MCPRATQTCGICEKLVSKYKCPSCLIPYCSLGCYKIHQETPCAKPDAASPTKEVPVVVEEANAKEALLARPINVEEEKFVLEKTQFEAIASCSEIRQALKDEALQKLICNIDTSSNPLLELDEAMGVEAFRELADKILSNISKSNEEQLL